MWDFANEPNSRNNEGDSFRTASPNPTTAHTEPLLRRDRDRRLPTPRLRKGATVNPDKRRGVFILAAAATALAAAIVAKFVMGYCPRSLTTSLCRANPNRPV
jgi:hypothetical protein